MKYESLNIIYQYKNILENVAEPNKFKDTNDLHVKWMTLWCISHKCLCSRLYSYEDYRKSDLFLFLSECIRDRALLAFGGNCDILKLFTIMDI